jgi:hypothetical protein
MDRSYAMAFDHEPAITDAGGRPRYPAGVAFPPDDSLLALASWSFDVVKVVGAGFNRLPNTRYSTLHFPRVVTIFDSNLLRLFNFDQIGQS